MDTINEFYETLEFYYLLSLVLVVMIFIGKHSLKTLKKTVTPEKKELDNPILENRGISIIGDIFYSLVIAILILYSVYLLIQLFVLNKEEIDLIPNMGDTHALLLMGILLVVMFVLAIIGFCIPSKGIESDINKKD